MTYTQKLAASSTFSINRASAVWPAVAGTCAAAAAAFRLPVNVNVYMTQLGHEVAVPPHNDRQDVCI